MSKKIYVVVFLLLCVQFSLAAVGLLSCISCVDIYATFDTMVAVNCMLFPPLKVSTTEKKLQPSFVLFLAL